MNSANSLEHLFTELERLDLRVRVQVRRERLSASGRDIFQPFYSSQTETESRLQIPAADPPAIAPATQMPTPEKLAAASDPSWGVHEKLGDHVQGEQLWQLAARYYGDPGLWRLIALANDIPNPLKIRAAKLLKIRPLKILKSR